MKMSGQRRVLATSPRKKNNLQFIPRRMGGPQRVFGTSGQEKNLLTLTGIELRFLTRRNCTRTE
jgi:hypothetical protein